MSLTKKEIQHIATLGRLECSEEEREQFAKQLSSILEYVAQLKEVNTGSIEYQYHVDGLENVRVADEISPGDPAVRKGIVDAFPHKAVDLLKVQGIFEE